MVNVLEQTQFKKAWAVISEGLMIKNNKDYEKAVEILDQLLEEVGDNQKNPLYGYLETLGILIENYEVEHFPVTGVAGVEALKYLMEEHGLKQNDFPEIGSQGVVSEVLHGKRELNIRQIRALSKRFKVSSAVFIDD